MELSREDELALKGERGEGARLAMEVLVAVGRAVNARGLIGITSAHISGVNYYNIGDSGLELLRDMSRTARFSVRTTVNPCGPPVSGDGEIPFRQEDVERQREIYEALRAMGATGGCTCVPYEGLNSPAPGEHVSWAESNAVVFGNSVMGIYTNRESGLSALAAAVVGRTPLYGLHVEENRVPRAYVRLRERPMGEAAFGALGHFIGRRFRETVGVVGIEGASRAELKALSASIGTYGSIGMFRMSREPERGAEVIDVGKREIDESLSAISDESRPDAVFLGCPFMTPQEIGEVLRRLEGRRPALPVYIFTYSEAYEEVAREFDIKRLRENNVHVVRDTCPSLSHVPELIGARAVLTDSAKASFYLRSSSGVKVSVADRERALERALSG